MAFMWIVLSTCLALSRFVLSLPTCGENDFHYEFTECDSHGGRWRVSVPQNPDTCEKGTPKPPRRENNCENSCPPGQYLDVNSEEMKCQKCPAGTYSLGGGVRYTNWNKLPQGFESTGSPTEIYYNSFDQNYYHSDHTDDKNSTCTREGGWFARGDHASSSTSKCTSTLTYAVTLVKKGFVKFKYQYTDMYTVFRFFVRNSQCAREEMQSQSEYPDDTDIATQEWREFKVELEAGRNLMTWIASIIEWESTEENRVYTPVRIKEVIFEGVGFTSLCTDCDPGTFSKEGAEYCKLCPENHFSSAKAESCLQCNTQTQYSLAGSPNCTDRKACTVNDFYETRSPCDENGKTKVMYKWIEPKICREDIEGSRELPASGLEEDCRHCNPGMFLNTTTKSCQYCPETTFSNGTVCEPCPVGTSPEYEYDLKWWNDFPPNLRASCFSHFDRACATKHGWQLQNTFLTSGTSHSDDALLWLRLTIDDGFLGSESVVNGKPGEVGMLSFQFEMTCSADCVLKLKEYPYKGRETLLNSWNGGQPRTNYKYIVTSNRPTSFIWTFLKSYKARADGDIATYKYINDKITMYYVKVTNVAKGGASKCRKCPLGSEDDKCSKCEVGHYLDTKLGKCFKCPENTYLNVSNPYEKKSCIACGAGLHSSAGSTECFSDCRHVTGSRHYDFTALSGFHHLNGGSSFTSRGSRYYHSFNISLCGHDVDATCRSNISVGSSQRQEEEVSGSICRLTMIPTQDGQLLAGQPMVLSHQLMSVSQELPKGLSINNLFDVKSDNNISDFVFNYQSALKTVACAEGFSSHIILRCDMTAPDPGILSLPSKCQEGTCDGCNFLFFLRTKYACPLCQETDFTSVTTACEHGKKSIHFMWNEPRFCRDGIPLPEIQNKTCSIFEQTVGSAVLDFKIVLAVAALLAVLLVFAVIGLWYRNRKLTYKYSRLVNASGKPGELPQVERCALEEDEEDNEEEVHFKKNRGKDIMNKLRNMTGGRRDEKSRNFLGDSEDEEYESRELHPHSSDDRV